MKKVLTTLVLASLLAGCATTRRKIFDPIKEFGRNSGRVGSDVLIVSGINPILIPVGVGIAIPFFVVAVPTYYGACFLEWETSDDNPFQQNSPFESDPFEP